ncbi:MAG: uroporphyrinogen decarboxylase [Burkholderiales bacterium]|nr:uroporphyrinogen decarboxylase [Burkholderiales bacterium]
MEKHERVRAALRGEALDRPPYSFWTHLPGIDLDWQRLAEATAAFQSRYQLDFVKSMPNGFYCIEDWGARIDFSQIAAGGTGRVTHAPINRADDWQRIARVDVAQGAYGRELRHLEALVARLGPNVPLLATVFSPLTIAAKLSRDAHRSHLRAAPESVTGALETITAVTCEFVRAAIARGCAGMFFALQEATRAAFTEAEYARFGEPFDREVIAAADAAGGWFNVLHLHGEDTHFDLVASYDATALNWHIGETPPSIEAYRARGGARPIVGGLQRAHLTQCDRDAVGADLKRALDETRGRGILIAPACVIRHPVDETMLQWTARTLRDYRGL